MNSVLLQDEQRPIDRTIARQAAHWLTTLYGGDAVPEDIKACERWRAADPEHERAWQRAQHINQRFGVVPASLGLAALGRTERNDRRRAIKALLLLMTAAPAAYVGWQVTPWRTWQADHRTAVGERREIRLADGSLVHLGTATSIDVLFDGNQRLLRLYAGEIMVTTGADAEAAGYRPFIVQTSQGRMRALGTRFVVRRDEDIAQTYIGVLEHAVEIRPQSSGDVPFVLKAGQQARFSARGVEANDALDPHSADWTRGVLFADRMRLADFAQKLGRYRSGLLRCDPAVADLRITGTFQLDNVQNILDALPDTLPVEVLYRSRYWVTLVAPAVTGKVE